MLNIAAIMGRLTADPELRHTTSGVPVTTFTLAVDRSYARQGQERQTDFIDVVAWRNTAEFVCKYFAKGRMMAVSGSIQTRNYEDKQGNRRKAFEIVANDISFADSRRDNNAGGSGGSSYTGGSSYGGNANAGGSGFESAPAEPQRPAFSEPAPAYSSGSDDDFTEVLGDDLPF